MRQFAKARKKPVELRFNPEGGAMAETVNRNIHMNPDILKEQIAGTSPTRALEHELGHQYFRSLPESLRRKTAKAQTTLRQDMGSYTEPLEKNLPHPYNTSRLARERTYLAGQDLSPNEFFAIASETPTALEGQLLTPEAKAAADVTRRNLRGMLRARARNPEIAKNEDPLKLVEKFADIPGNKEFAKAPNTREWWGEVMRDLPDYARDRVTEMSSTVSHTATPTEKEAIYRSIRAYADRVRGLRKQGEK
jgi:hypothetical protein